MRDQYLQWITAQDATPGNADVRQVTRALQRHLVSIGFPESAASKFAVPESADQNSADPGSENPRSTKSRSIKPGSTDMANIKPEQPAEPPDDFPLGERPTAQQVALLKTHVGHIQAVVMAEPPDNPEVLQEALQEALQSVSKLASLLDAMPHCPDKTLGLNCLLDAIRHGENISLMIHAMSVLSRLRVAEAVPLLIDVLLATQIDLYERDGRQEFLDSDHSLRLRCAAAQALGKLADQQAILSLMSTLNDKSQNYRLRLAAAESLGKIGHEQALTPLLDILADEREKSIYLKESAVKALGMLGDIRAIEPLIEILESKRGIRDKFNFLKEQIIEAVARIGRPSAKATDSLLYALKDEAPSIRLAAVEALAEIGDRDCLPKLEQMVYDAQDDIACAAIQAMYRLGGEEEVRRLLLLENLPQFLRDELESYIP